MVSVQSCPHKQAYNTARGKSRWLFGVVYVGGVVSWQEESAEYL